jgi:hypothetical protein
MKDGMNVLGLITFSIGFGIILGAMGPAGQVMTNFFFVLNEIIMRLVKLVIWYSPIGIMCLISGKILGVANIADTARMLGTYKLQSKMLTEAVTQSTSVFFQECIWSRFCVDWQSTPSLSYRAYISQSHGRTLGLFSGECCRLGLWPWEQRLGNVITLAPVENGLQHVVGAEPNWITLL